MTNPAHGNHTFLGTPLPEHCGVVVLDQVAFTQQPGSVQAEFASLIGRLTDEALSRAGLDAVRENKLFLRDRGDGFAFGCSPKHLPELLDQFLPELQAVLAHHNVQHGSRQLRLRAAITCGPLPAEGLSSDGYGTARNEAHRLVDAAALKWAMAQASPNATHLGVIVSDRVYQDVVVDRYCTLHPDQFVRITATVPGKTFRAVAWIHVPAPSGGLLTVPSAPPCGPPEAAGRVPAAPGAPVRSCEHRTSHAAHELVLSLQNFIHVLRTQRRRLTGPIDPGTAPPDPSEEAVS
ncbi:hypothetical protein ACIQBJ_21035 [Kitasatospora sp. NPDC088391]|uniref:hypothetical protein n=1 Tax=Kitasatospora sp. NPDC088391 TaxID=3364074 RepID=UPI003825FBA1